jgi:putative endonuclease
MMANRSRTLYCGVTSDLVRRVCEHKTMQNYGFARRYLIDRLVYFEQGDYIRDAIAREKQVKGWTRAKKVALIESMNPGWEDLSVKLELVTAEILRSFRSLSATFTPQDYSQQRSLSATFAPQDDSQQRSLSATSAPQDDSQQRSLSATYTPQDDGD